MTDTTPVMGDAIYEMSESDARTIYPVVRRMWSGRTAFQAVEIADSPTYGRMLFLDGELQSASADEVVYHEALVHPAMTAAAVRLGSVSGGAGAAAAGLRVLVVGGGEGATVREVLRWSCVERVDWVDIDGELMMLCEEHLGWAPGVRADRRVRFFAEDVMVAVPRLGETYDVVILDLPDPDGETGALYSPEFWAMIREHLRSDGGRLVTHCGPVRPFGNVGEGFQRVWGAAQAGDIEAAVGGFYHIGIPSFQGEWGFWMMVTGTDRDRPFDFARSGTSLSVLRAIAPVEASASWFDFTWLTRCAAPDRLWSRAVMSAVGGAST